MYVDHQLGGGNSLESCLQILSTGLQLAGVVQGTVCGRSEGAILGALGELELTVLGNVAAVVGNLCRGTFVARNALALEGRENGARGAAVHKGYQILVALVVDLAVVVVGEASLLGADGRVTGTHALHTASAARVEFLGSRSTLKILSSGTSPLQLTSRLGHLLKITQLGRQT